MKTKRIPPENEEKKCEKLTTLTVAPIMDVQWLVDAPLAQLVI